MKKTCIHALVIMLAALAAGFVMVSPDDAREFDSAYVRREALKECQEDVAAHRKLRVLDPSWLANESNNRRSRSPRAAAMTVSPTLFSISTCVLLC